MNDHKPSESAQLSPEEHLLTHDLKAVIDRGEDMRVAFMKEHRGRSFVAMTLSLLIITAGGAAFGWFLLVQGDMLRALGFMILALAPPAFLYVWANGPIKEYKHQYKASFLADLAKAMGNFKYYPTRGIASNILSKTGIVPAHGHYSAEDCFMGTHSNAKIILSEARLKRQESDKAYIFDGIFALVELAQPSFEGHTIVTADAALAQRMTKLSPIPLTGTGYEGTLSCFSNNAANAPRFQDKSLLKEVSELVSVFEDAPLSAAFFRKKYIFIAIPHQADMFEPSTINVPITTTNTALRCKQEIEQILSIIDLMDVYQEDEAQETS